MAIYYVWSGAAGSGTGATWANAFTTLTAAFVTEAAGDTLYVAHDHAESTAAAITLTSSGTITNPTKVICVNRAGSVPPVSADRRTTATVNTTTGTANISFDGFTHYDGIIFSGGVGNSGSVINFITPNSAGKWLRFDNCSLRIMATLGGKIYVGNGNGGCLVEFNNTTVQYNVAAGTGIDITGAFRWRNTASAVLGALIPTALFNSPGTPRGGLVEVIGVDLSALGSGKTLVNVTGNQFPVPFRFIDCKLNASVTKSVAPTTPGAVEIDFVRCGATGINYAISRYRMAGALDHETTIVRTGGATDGTTPIAWKVITTANCNYSVPFDCPPIAIWNDTTGSAKTATIECVWGGGAVPLDSEIWVDLEYLGDAASPHGSFVNDGTPDLITTPANQASSSATWGGSTTKFKLDVVFTAQQKGWVYCRVRCAKPSSTFYIDPLCVLS